MINVFIYFMNTVFWTPTTKFCGCEDFKGRCYFGMQISRREVSASPPFLSPSGSRRLKQMNNLDQTDCACGSS